MARRGTVAAALAGALIIVALLAPASSAAVTVVRASVSTSGAQADFNSNGPALSANGRYVLFTSFADNLVAGDTNNTYDIFVHDLQTGTTTRVDVSSAGTQAERGTIGGAISADGRYIAFSTSSANLVPGDTNRTADVFIRDTVSRTTRRVTLKPGGRQARYGSIFPFISGDGRFVGFTSRARLVPGDHNARDDVYVFDRSLDRMDLVDVRRDGRPMRTSPLWGGYEGLSISPDGRYVLFVGDTPPGSQNGPECWVRDLVEHTTHRISAPIGGGHGLGCLYAAMSGNDRVIAFQAGTTGHHRIYLRDRQTHKLTYIRGAGGTQASLTDALSANGNLVAFDSNSSKLVPGDTNGVADVFLYNRITRTIQRVSLSASAVQGNAASDAPTMSADGSVLAFESYASNLVAGDTNVQSDIFVRR